MNNCSHCTKETSNPKYCSRACAARTNNKLHPKRVTQRKCLVCSQPVKSYRHSRCELHHQEYKANKYTSLTIGSYRDRQSLSGKHPSWTHSHVRILCRNWNKHLMKVPCVMCGYSKHIELAHIKPLSEFADDTPLSEVNGVRNIIPLCPNCHWEFDHLPRDVAKLDAYINSR